MKKLMNSISSLALLAAALFAAGCDRTSIDEAVVSAPVIHSFSPASAPVGEEIVITGEYLNAVTKATIGGVEVPISERVSNTRISIVASADARSGRIALSNTEGTGESAEEFVYTYAAPEITTAILQSSVDMGDQMLIAGRYMGAVEAVIFTAEGYTEGNEAAIVSRTSEELVVKCPYVEADQARITLRYFDGTSHVETPLADAPSIEVKRYKPTFDAVVLERTAVGRSVTLTGSYLTKVDQILVGGFPAVVSREASKLTFTVPAGDFVDGDTSTTLVATYFDGHESVTLADDFVVYVPFVKFWEGMRTYGQGRDVESMASFFSPETGLVYANSDWRTQVDPVSYKYLANTCSGPNTPNKAVVSEQEYDSVNPYFFFSGVSAGQLQVNSPANSTGQLKNFYMINNSADENRVTGYNGNVYGTPVLTFRYLSPSNAAEKALIDAVRNHTLEHIDEQTFPIDVNAKTVGGISITSAKGTVNSDVWAPGVFTAGVEASNVAVDAVLMVFYYGYEGSASNVADNIRRIGLLHIRSVNFKMWNNTVAPSSSDVLFDIYWQKYDYDYSKVK
ncbi:MAG: IPT/TIG domain-containing protein [Alistipes sp.]|nr:IPT/TIG domain-containing protein [Alistipes sp.]MDE6778283.1 IPT/TIG domain-containing protein [Alistipes sp.]